MLLVLVASVQGCSNLKKRAPWAAVDSGLYVAAQRFELGLLQCSLFFKESKAIPDNLARALVAAGFELLADKPFEVTSNDVA
ncbi:hypothetical protein VARIO8X_50052 [Burkholderiales bacterium 8X]|nr:hypothetical protein VARIO8X_50052 [Burkholderiales bacterium 8X]